MTETTVLEVKKSYNNFDLIIECNACHHAMKDDEQCIHSYHVTVRHLDPNVCIKNLQDQKKMLDGLITDSKDSEEFGDVSRNNYPTGIWKNLA